MWQLREEINIRWNRKHLNELPTNNIVQTIRNNEEKQQDNKEEWKPWNNGKTAETLKDQNFKMTKSVD